LLTQIYYASAAYFGSSIAVFTCGQSDSLRTNCVLHIYVQSDSAADAGGVLGSFQLTHGLEFREFLCLPAPILSSSVLPTAEHEHAYQRAVAEGCAYVLSVSLDDEGALVEYEV